MDHMDSFLFETSRRTGPSEVSRLRLSHVQDLRWPKTCEVPLGLECKPASLKPGSQKKFTHFPESESLWWQLGRTRQGNAQVPWQRRRPELGAKAST